MKNKKLSVKIEKMKKENLDEVMEIETISYPNHHWSKDSFFNELSNKLAHYYCVKDKNADRVLAYVGYWQILEEAHITTLAVHPDFRKQQLAQILLKTLIDDCYKQMIKYITLEVRESNIAAISLYEKFGFKSIGQRKNYYQDNGENAIIMFTENIWHEKFKNLYEELKKTIMKV
ncbi:MAG: ribosomal protein S18-alanine N-acetyltransferase [Candidatus Gastranaerophilales bacterium]|nr:ribosomal protein S18-alanine N-acetyltransferase [Candidatus Gastranaerophilales bacterium]